jgi:hypothetical protein
MKNRGGATLPACRQVGSPFLSAAKAYPLANRKKQFLHRFTKRVRVEERKWAV